MKMRRFWLAAMLGILVTPVRTMAEVKGMGRPESSSVRLPVDSEFPSLASATGWLNSQPLTAAGLRGKVVLIDFWTYTCISWRRSLPYVRAWSEKYKDHGLVVIGVHSPEFEFEKDFANVERAVKDVGVDHPVAIDSGHVIWRAFRNQYWPARYFIDAQGRIRYHQFGEGEYEKAETVIRQLLTEAGSSGLGSQLASIEPRPAKLAADWADLRSPETYFRYDGAGNFASSDSALLDQRRVYSLPQQLSLNHWALSGDWTRRDQGSVLHQAGGRTALRFHARDLHLVMGPAMPGTSVRFRVLIEGQPPGASHGIEVDDQGNGTVTEQRLYLLIRQPGLVADRRFEIEFLDPGMEIFVFTFG